MIPYADMEPREPTQEECEFWGRGAEIIEMKGEHVGAANLKVIRDQNGYIRVPWEYDSRDNVHLPEGRTLWTTFVGGMLPTDAVIV